MANGIVQVPPDSTGKKIDAASLDVGADSVIRQRIVIGDNSATSQFATVTGGALLVTQSGAVNISAMPAINISAMPTVTVTGTVAVNGGVAVSGTAVVAFATPQSINNISATVTVQGNINISTMPSVVIAAGAANIGTINGISATVVVAGIVSLAVGTANIGTINNISAAVVVSGAVSIAAGTANIGFIDHISAAVALAAGTANIGAVSLAAGTANIGFINGISAPVALAAGAANIGYINHISAPTILAAGSANIGSINNISATVNTVIGAGAANIGFINNISAPVVLAAGAANIGSINNISATVNAVIGQGSNNIGGVSLVAGTANIGFINGISATVNVAFAGGISLAAGTANIGFIDHISATVTVQGNIAISGTAIVGMSFITEKTSNSQVQVGDSANAAIRVNIVAGAVGGAGGTSMTDGASFDTQITLFTPMGGIFDDAASNTLSENDAGVVRITTNRAMHANLRTDGGVKMDDSTNSALRVNVVAGSAGGPSMIDNTTFSTGASNLAPAGFIFFSASATVVTDGRLAAGRITDARGQHVNLRNNAGTEIGTAATPLSVKVENQSATVSVIIAAGANNIGTINNISSTVTIVGIVVNAAGTSNIGGVSLVAGTANIGFINNISATVNVAFAGGISLAAGTANIGFLNGISATVNVAFAGGISLAAGTANIGFLNGISATVNVAFAGGISLAAGTSNIGFINNISATVNTVVGAGTALMGAVSIAAGTANIGFIDKISAAVAVIGSIAGGASATVGNSPVLMGGTDGSFARMIATDASGNQKVTLVAGATNIGTINNISAAVVLAAGAANIGTINGISATVTVAGAISLGAGTALIGAVSLAAGTSNIGFIDKISATVAVNLVACSAGVTVLANLRTDAGIKLEDSANQSLRVSIVNATATLTVVTSNPWVYNIASASHGPRMVTISTSATATLIAAPGAGLHIYVTQLAVSNAGTVLTGAQIGWSGSIGLVNMACAANGGGFVMNFDPPWKVQSNEAVLMRVDPNTSGNCFFNVNFYVST